MFYVLIGLLESFIPVTHIYKSYLTVTCGIITLIMIFHCFRFEVAVKFSIPNIVLDPPLMPIQHALDLVAKNIMHVPQG